MSVSVKKNSSMLIYKLNKSYVQFGLSHPKETQL